MVPSCTLAVIEPNQIYRQGLIHILQEAGYSDCVGFNEPNAIADVEPSASSRSVVLVDRGDGGESLARTIQTIRSRWAVSSVIVLSESYSDHDFIEALKAGAQGFVLKAVSRDVLVQSVELAALGQPVIPTQALQLMWQPAPGEPSPAAKNLSSREIEVLNYLSDGSSNKVIARRFGISEATVKVHVKAILRKIQLKNRTEAAIWARTNGVAFPEIASSLRESQAFMIRSSPAR